ncbi:hypothetical protein OGAPHI_004520 [Ogataea philodendri]|uniref:Uncharacterized protein n=1 Tax=Ogataea philodendri TaxID=1378263 RepID=A0A9P8T518_9ASCO|nr:uncharacterized protein OGAPHI_004520 [Ogataea philodendri]KAH3666331.1 hypothetical protein OGAPHI_004520 [Ogataea philodendri]
MHFRDILWCSDDCSNHLQHRSDSRTSCNHDDLAGHVCLVRHSSDRAFELDELAGLESSKPRRHSTVWVRLHQDIKKSFVVLVGDRGVVANDLFVVNNESAGQMVTNRNVQSISFAWKLESVYS